MAIRCFGLMLALVRCLITVSIALLLHVAPAAAVLNSDSYDGNIYALYAGNGSLGPPANTLEESLAEGRTAVIVYYLDDSAVSKRFAPVVSELQRLWGRSIDLCKRYVNLLALLAVVGAMIDIESHYDTIWL